MPKPRRGKNARRIPNWRGTCPVCARKRVKVLWTFLNGGSTVKCCKHCGTKVRGAV